MKALFVATFGAASVFAQTVVPVEREPHHRLVFENAFVKVLEVTFPAGAVSLFHEHAMDNVAIRITGGRMKVDQLAAEGSPTDVPAGSVVFNSATPPYTHRVGNAGTRTVRIVDVELVRNKPVPDGRAADVRISHVTVLENERVRVSRVQLRPGASLASHTHPTGWLEVVAVGQNAGRFVWRGAGERIVTDATAPTEIVEVEPR